MLSCDQPASGPRRIDIDQAAGLPPTHRHAGAPPARQELARQVEAALDVLAGARRPLLLAGLGAYRSGAAQPIAALADRLGALLTTTVMADGLYRDNQWSLGICGSFASPSATAIMGEADASIASRIDPRTLSLALVGLPPAETHAGHGRRPLRRMAGHVLAIRRPIGDGGALMGLPDLETLIRVARSALVVIFDDAAYGAEVHMYGHLVADISPAAFGDTGFAAAKYMADLSGHIRAGGI